MTELQVAVWTPCSSLQASAGERLRNSEHILQDEPGEEPVWPGVLLKSNVTDLLQNTVPAPYEIRGTVQSSHRTKEVSQLVLVSKNLATPGFTGRLCHSQNNVLSQSP